jgi:hypothetical protein
MGEIDDGFIQVLNELMDNVPLEVFSKKLIEEHYKRMRTFEGRSWRKVKNDLKDL